MSYITISLIAEYNDFLLRTSERERERQRAETPPTDPPYLPRLQLHPHNVSEREWDGDPVVHLEGENGGSPLENEITVEERETV